MPENSDVNPLDDLHIAYLARGEFEDGKAYRAGILIVDLRGTPLEFRCTSPIRPNPVQRTLYGESLEPHMLVELMGKPLTRSLRESFAVVLVNEPTLLNLRDEFDRPTVYLRRQGADLDPGAHNAQDESALLVESPAGKFDPVVLLAFREHSDDTRAVHPILEAASRSLDLLEPFARVVRALEQVHEQKALDQQ